MVKPKVAVLMGQGINSHQETGASFAYFKAEVEYVYIWDFLSQPQLLNNFQILVFPGGFSFADELGSGQVMALELRTKALDLLLEFYQRGGLILGICNGFQILTKLGLLPLVTGQGQVALTHNQEQKFINRWVTLKKNPNSSCIWLKQVPDQFELPIRHGEGRLVLPKGMDLALEHQALTYTQDINGSVHQLAALSDQKGQILGLMPHPEAGFYQFQSPYKKLKANPFSLLPGALIFKSAVDYFN